jgi:hypothetical protein
VPQPEVAEVFFAEEAPEVLAFRSQEVGSPTIDAVIQERRRRLSEGFTYDFGAPRGTHHIGTTEDDLIGWDEVTKFAQAAISAGLPSQPISIVTNTGPMTTTAIEWQSVLLAAAQHRQPIFAASFALQAMDPIPADYADDSHWP